jgi:quinol monooxygenase YgiN
VIAEHVEIRVREGCAGDLESGFDEIRALLLAAPGCSDAALAASVDRQDTYLLTARWARLEDHTETFAGSESGARVRRILEPLCAEMPRVTHYCC